MIDTIDYNVLQRVADKVRDRVSDNETVHTVTITLNGAHGGVDVKAESFVADGPDATNEWVVS